MRILPVLLRILSGLAIVSALGALPACLPKASETVTCTTDSECAAIDPRLRCDPVQRICTCAGAYVGGACLGADGGTKTLDASDAPDGLFRDLPMLPIDSSAQDMQTADTALVVDAAEAIDEAAVDVAVDARVPDAEGSCATNGDCPDPGKAFCVGNQCVGCQLARSDACTAPASVCNPATGMCVACTADTHCSQPAAPICDKTKNLCGACSADSQCQGKNAATPACRTDGQCVACTAKTTSACTGATPVCDTQSSACVQCVADASCAGATPLCGSDKKCHGCSADSECARLGDAKRSACAQGGACVECTTTNATKCSGNKSVCNTTADQCVECVTNATCAGSSPICATSTNTCRACAAATECAGFAGRTACAASGACVECTDDSTCSGAKPICQTSAGASAPVNSCRACAADSECARIGPSVCMSDGHCATDAETVYVGPAGNGLCSASNAGTSALPVCSLASGVGLARMNGRPLVVVRGVLAPASTTIAVNAPITIIGKSGATLSAADPGADCITLTQGEITLRNLAIQGTASPATGMGLNVATTSGATVSLHMETCAVRNNPGGGILLNGAAFDLRNIVVSGNGPGTIPSSGLTWGGVYVQNLPASGSTSFDLVSIQSNNGGGLTCAGTVQASGLLASLNTNTVNQIGSLCAVTSCAAASPTCGAQVQPQ